MNMHDDQRRSVIADKTIGSIHAWQDRIRDPSLAVLLALELSAMFLAAPLTAKGLPMAQAIADTLLFAGADDRRGAVAQMSQ